MTVAFASKKGRALMGKVTEDRGNAYVVEVTSYESKRDKNLVGKTLLVFKQNAKVIN